MCYYRKTKKKKTKFRNGHHVCKCAFVIGVSFSKDAKENERSLKMPFHVLAQILLILNRGNQLDILFSFLFFFLLVQILACVRKYISKCKNLIHAKK